MVDDFDWDGATLTVGDDEAQQSLVLVSEPTVNQQGVDTPGMLSGHSDFVNYGLYNGNFRLGPPDPSQNIDVASSTSGSNFIPHWRFVQSSNTNITLSQVRDASSPSGSNLRFTFASGAAADEAYVEQIVELGTARSRSGGDVLRASSFMPSGSGGRITIAGQYMTVDGSMVGMPAEQTAIINYSSAGTTASRLTLDLNTGTAIPANAARLRVRIRASRNSGTGALTIDVSDIRRDRAIPFLVIPDTSSPETNLPGQIKQQNGILRARANQDSMTDGILGPHLVALHFAYVDMPAGATTDLYPVDGAGGLGANPTIPMPWGGHVVGMSYRMTDAATAGTFNLRATVNGSNVWAPFGAIASPASGSASQALGTDTFAAGDTIGVHCVTSAGYLPTTRDFAVIVWVALNYLGA